MNAQEIYRTEYYADAPFYESPLHPFKFSQQITEHDAKSRINIKVDYDVLGRIVQISIRVGEKLKDLDGAFYGMNIHAPVTKINYANNTEIHQFFDRFGNRIEIMSNVYEKLYEKDKFDRNIKLSYLNKNGEEVTGHTGAANYTWTHQTDGSVIETRKDLDGNIVALRGAFQFMKTRMIYGPNGFFSMLQNIDENGQLVNSESGAAVYKYYFDLHDRFLRWEVYDKDLNPTKGPSNTGGEINIFEGNEFVGIDFFDIDHESPALHWSGAERFRMFYDKYGNETKREYQTAKGDLMNNGSGYAIMQKQWSEDGQFLLAIELLDKDSNPVESQYSGHQKVEFIRNDAGLVTEKRHYGLKGLKSHKSSGVAIIKYSYNEQKQLTEESSFDDKELPLKG